MVRKRADSGDEQVSLLDVSARRLPGYLVAVEAVVVLGLVLAVVQTVQLEKCACLESIAYFLGALAEYLNRYVSGAILMCGATEGVIVGLNAIRTRQLVERARREERREAREEGIQEGIRMERERFRRDGASIFRCPVWGTPATNFPTTRNAAVFGIDSPRAGGRYEISLSLFAELMNKSITLTEEEREAITGWLAHERSVSPGLPVLTSEVVRNHIQSPEEPKRRRR